MRVLLVAMPDVASSFDRVMRMPNLGITSLAANVDGAEVKILDLVLHSRAVSRAVRRTLAEFQPHVVGLSAMTFQYDTAKHVARIVRETVPKVRTVLGGYHATLAYDDIASDPGAEVFDFLIRGEGEAALNALVQALKNGQGWTTIPGLSYRTADGFVHNPRGPLLDLSRVHPPAREARLTNGFRYFGRRFDMVETSRGCTRACRFCSIRQMYGSEYRRYPIPRIVADIEGAAAAGAKGIFFADDNINLDPNHFRGLCEAIVAANLSHLEYLTQADVSGFANDPGLVPLMQRAGFRGVFLGIESVNGANWKFLRKSNPLSRTAEVVRNLRAHGIAVAGGFILGNPDDDADAIRFAFRTARDLDLDHAIMWCLTPYPGTEARADLLAEGLVANRSRFDRYNGFICNIRTRRLDQAELVRLIAREGLKLYLHPRFIFRGRAWGRSPGAVIAYLQCTLEYLTRGYRNQLYASRHRM
jgi:anaerobic magnesium-protoporphyrin IX monomethyl ester cyclase